VIAEYFPECVGDYSGWFGEVVKRTADMIAQWQAVGFAHGVMNTDNMSILGLTIDYGPYGFMDAYDPQFICNHTDEQGRYSFINQPMIRALEFAAPWRWRYRILSRPIGFWRSSPVMRSISAPNIAN
jgi:uncharacterized protein YdiU (UPF0061 family)